MMCMTTRWENVKNRANYLLKNSSVKSWEGCAWRAIGMALCEELDRMQERIDALEVEGGAK